ncbi:hypothetical protein IV203_031445 [Nitzschia inconspicua]|uniref:Uncharacterized protein n=1 Tax=Nitzschia inconspicua TaxID=303405 RepID=A0A9K3LUW6_9STRA|nr:hypothetical protein IV203_031445 [Nitzschia inconspicua]
MEFEEVFTSPFTSQTTCYLASYSSGCSTTQKSFQAPEKRIHFATESHVLSVNVRESDGQEILPSSRLVSQDSSRLICVGYSRTEKKSTDGKDVVLEAMALVNTIHVNEEILFQEESSTQHLLQPSFSNTTEKDYDAASVVSHTDASSTAGAGVNRNLIQQPSPLNHRRVSSTASAMTTSSATGTVSTSSKSRHHKSTSEISTSSSINSHSDREGGPNHNIGTPTSSIQSRNMIGSEDATTAADPAASSKKDEAKKLFRDSKARLILSQESHTIANPEDTPRPHYFSTLLDFRPLNPCIAVWNLETNTQVTGVFVGSADDASVRFYVPSLSNPRSLVSTPLPDEHFLVEAPVMALDFYEVRWPEFTMCTLAMGCQDGTIQLVTWECSINGSTDLFYNTSSHRVIVDGPLVCIKLDYNDSTSLRVTVGSLCGYVCQLFYKQVGNHSSSSEWEGPFLVAQDLWNSLLDEEDSVLAVDAIDNFVAVGTQVGRCILYATRDSENYFPVWQCLLPYSTHDIRILKGDDEGTMSIAVTTRRSFHLFRVTRGSVGWIHKPSKKIYHADIAGTRLLDILKAVRERNKNEDNANKMIVAATVEDILNRVVDTIPEPKTETPTDTQEESLVTSIVTNTLEELLNRVDLRINMSDHTARNVSERSFSSRGPQLEYSSSEDDGDLVVQPDMTTSSDPLSSNTIIETVSSSEGATPGEDDGAIQNGAMSSNRTL